VVGNTQSGCMIVLLMCRSPGHSPEWAREKIRAIIVVSLWRNTYPKMLISLSPARFIPWSRDS